MLIFIFVSTIFVRGGFQPYPLNVRDAYSSDKLQLGSLSLNGIYTTLDSLYQVAKGKELSCTLQKLQFPLKPAREVLRYSIENDKEKSIRQ